MAVDMFFRVAEVNELPIVPCENTVYRILSQDRGSDYYNERTDRNIGWITPAEQALLRDSVVGIAGCGGMGGLVAATLLRLGVGELRIADCETFDVSNLNRQFGAIRATIGNSKAFETAKMLRDITDDSTVSVYPQGITESTVDHFLEGCDVVCDEIEFWAVGARILLHKQARHMNVPVMNCSSVGFGSRLFLFDHRGMNMKGMLSMSYDQARILQEKISNGTATPEEVDHVLFTVLHALIPELPEYGIPGGAYQSSEYCIRRLREEQRAPIIATNPPFASGFVANQLVLELLRKSGVVRSVVRPPSTPGYLYVDAALMEARTVVRQEIRNDFR